MDQSGGWSPQSPESNRDANIVVFVILNRSRRHMLRKIQYFIATIMIKYCKVEKFIRRPIHFLTFDSELSSCSFSDVMTLKTQPIDADRLDANDVCSGSCSWLSPRNGVASWTLQRNGLLAYFMYSIAHYNAHTQRRILA